METAFTYTFFRLFSDLYMASSFHSMVVISLEGLMVARAYTKWVQRKGSTFSGVNFPLPGLYWDQFVTWHTSFVEATMRKNYISCMFTWSRFVITK